MKKILAFTASLAMAMSMCIAPVCAADSNNISNLTVNENTTTKQVTVKGNTSAGSGKNVTIEVLDPNGGLDYIGQVVSTDDGKFEVTFTSNNVVEGAYTVKIGGEGISTPAQTDFKFPNASSNGGSTSSGGSSSSGGSTSSSGSTTQNTAAPTTAGTFKRVAGLNRADTSIAIAKEQFNNKQPDAIVLTSGRDFPDALGGSGLAYKQNAPVLLAGNSVNDSKNVLDYIIANLAKGKNIYILGGTASVSTEISDYLKAQGYNIIRLGGKDRYETNQKIVDSLNVAKGTPIIIASGNNFADALSISSIADIKGYPVLINDKDNLSTNVSNDMASIQPTDVYIIGGTGALSANIENQIKNINGNINIVRLGGKDRYETSMMIAEKFNLNTDTITVSSGINFPDALSGSVLAARKNSSILLIDNNDISKQKALLSKQKITNVIVLGGEGVISNDAANSLVQK